MDPRKLQPRIINNGTVTGSCNGAEWEEELPKSAFLFTQNEKDMTKLLAYAELGKRCEDMEKAERKKFEALGREVAAQEAADRDAAAENPEPVAEITEDLPPEVPPRPWYRKPLVWVAILVVLILLSSCIFTYRWLQATPTPVKASAPVAKVIEVPIPEIRTTSSSESKNEDMTKKPVTKGDATKKKRETEAKTKPKPTMGEEQATKEAIREIVEEP